MNWLSKLLPSNNSNELKPTFGQEYLFASGYDDLHEQLHYKDGPNIGQTSSRNDLQISLEVASSFVDYPKLCKLFGIAKFEFLKFIANRSNRMEEILQFLNKNINGTTLICNIYVVKQEAIVNYHSKSQKATRQISKFNLGHHIILCIPLATTIEDLIGAKAILTSLINRDARSRFADYFLSDSVALIDYTDIIEKPAFEILSELQDYQFQNNISLFVELSKFDRLNNYSTAHAERSALLIILKLKKLNYLLEEKFALESNFNFGKKPMGLDERDQIADIVIANIKRLGDLDVSTFPPPTIIVLYNHSKVYEREYLFALFENIYVPGLHAKLEEYLDIALRTINKLPVRRFDNIWLLKANDENAHEIYNKYLAKKWCILMTKSTKHLISDFFNDTLLWVITEEAKWKASNEPVLMFDGNDEYLLGMITPQKSNNQTFKNGIVFRSCCNCKNDVGVLKAWICTKCKYLFRTVDENEVYCECGVYDENTLEKRCFKCVAKEIENPKGQNNSLTKEKHLSFESMESENSKPPSTLMLKNVVTPRPSTSTPATPTTPISTIPKVIAPVKNKFNILFIGQSGAGKSMLVNSIYNYLTYNFDEVSKAETVDCILPCQFQLQTKDFKKIVFKAGPEDENEHFNDSGESVTQHPKVYNFETTKYDCKVIDTPGLGDTRGAKQDAHNLDLIRNAIIDINELHAICFVMPSNISKLTANFEVNMRDLLSLFPKTALKNVHFFFTYANSTFFSIGDTRNSLEEFISTFKATNNAEIPFNPENVCCVDSEAFMYFIATKQGHKYQNRDLESFRISWDKSKAAIETFLSKLEKVSSIKSDNILMTYELEQIGTLLQKEENPALKGLIPHIITTISQISMTSKFNLAKKPSSEPLNDSKKPELFQALEICEKNVENPNLKQFISKLVIAYGNPKVNENAENVENAGQLNGIKRVSAAEEKAQINGKTARDIKPDPLKKRHFKWPNQEQLRKVAEKLGQEWESGKLKETNIENVLNVQIAGNQKPENINKSKLKESLDLLMMPVSNELAAEIRKLLENYNL